MIKNKAYPILQGKQDLLLGDANDDSFAHASANLTKELNAGVITTYSNDKARQFVDFANASSCGVIVEARAAIVLAMSTASVQSHLSSAIFAGKIADWLRTDKP